MQVRYGETGVPIVLNDAIAFLECKVVQTIDVGTHFLFIGELVQSEILNDTSNLSPICITGRLRKALHQRMPLPMWINQSLRRQPPVRHLKNSNAPPADIFMMRQKKVKNLRIFRMTGFARYADRKKKILLKFNQK